MVGFCHHCVVVVAAAGRHSIAAERCSREWEGHQGSWVLESGATMRCGLARNDMRSVERLDAESGQRSTAGGVVGQMRKGWEGSL